MEVIGGTASEVSLFRNIKLFSENHKPCQNLPSLPILFINGNTLPWNNNIIYSSKQIENIGVVISHKYSMK